MSQSAIKEFTNHAAKITFKLIVGFDEEEVAIYYAVEEIGQNPDGSKNKTARIYPVSGKGLDDANSVFRQLATEWL